MKSISKLVLFLLSVICTSESVVEKIIVSLSIMAPHMASELAESLLGKQLKDCGWPTFDPTLVVEDEVMLVVQVNGKVRANLPIKRGATEQDVSFDAQASVGKWLEGKEIIKVIFVQDKLINLVVK